MATPDDLESDEFADLGDATELAELNDIVDDDDDDDLDVDDVDGDDDPVPEGDGKGDDDSADDEEGEEPESDLDGDDPAEEEEESLDVILAREQDLEDEFAPGGDGPRTSPTSTPAGEDEFTCRSCFLVKRRAQLAEEDEMICLDCA